MKFSIITCISNPDIYDKCVLESVNNCRGDHDIEIIPIINNGNLYSASAALNIGIDVSRSNHLIFIHQDVRLLGSWFDKLEATIHSLSDDWGIIGTAGINLDYGCDHIGKWGGSIIDDTITVGTVYSDDNSDPYWDGTKAIARVHCIDECLFVLNKHTGIRFDLGFNGFHFYGVDVCLQSRAAAFNVYGADLPIIHYGKYSASMAGNQQYWKYFLRLFNKWKYRFPELLGTHMHWRFSNINDTELTSYIPNTLEDGEGLVVKVKSMGVSRFEENL